MQGTQIDNVLYGTTDGQGGHTIDVADTAALKTSQNTSSFTAGGVVLHELAEGLAEVNSSAAGGQSPHQFANKFAPGLQKLGVIPTQTQGALVLSGTIVHGVQDGSGTRLHTNVTFNPAMPWSQRTTWSRTGPVNSVKSVP